MYDWINKYVLHHIVKSIGEEGTLGLETLVYIFRGTPNQEINPEARKLFGGMLCTMQAILIELNRHHLSVWYPFIKYIQRKSTVRPDGSVSLKNKQKDNRAYRDDCFQTILKAERKKHSNVYFKLFGE